MDFQTSDRVGVSDDFTEGALLRWKREGGLPEGRSPQEFFDFDIRLFGFDQGFSAESEDAAGIDRINAPSTGEALTLTYEKAKRQDRFLALSFMEPFEHISGVVGREQLLMMMAEDADRAAGLFANSLDFTLNMCQLILDKGYTFDGAWLWGDLAHKKGLMFSTDYYRSFLFDLHKELCDFFTGKGMPVIFHSDGNVKELIPHLIKAGVRAIEPLESDVGMDLPFIKREYGAYVVLFGGIDEMSFTDKDRTRGEIASKFDYLMNGGGYIYHADSPIQENVRFEDYKYAIETVRKYGSY